MLSLKEPPLLHHGKINFLQLEAFLTKNEMGGLMKEMTSFMSLPNQLSIIQRSPFEEGQMNWVFHIPPYSEH